MSIFYLNGSNDLATVPISAINIRLLVKQLFSFAKIQQFVGYTKKSMFFNDRCRQGVFKGFQRAFKRLSMNFKMALKKAQKMHKYAKTAFIKKRGLSAFFLSRHGTISKNLRTFALGFGFVSSPRHFGKT